MRDKQTILLIGFSTRAFAESAVRGGYKVIALDYFGDTDQKQLVTNYSLHWDFGTSFNPTAIIKAVKVLSTKHNFQHIICSGGLENHPQKVKQVTAGKTLLGNSPEALRAVRNPRRLRKFCETSQVSFPKTYTVAELQKQHIEEMSAEAWLSKPKKSGGGSGISICNPHSQSKLHVKKTHYLQNFIPGIAGSALFVGDGRRSVLLGLTEQISGYGEETLIPDLSFFSDHRNQTPPRGFRWAGNILPLKIPGIAQADVIHWAEITAEQLTAHFCLRGLNGFDFIISYMKNNHHDGQQPLNRQTKGFYLLEVNPRYTASMELVEKAYHINMFDIHYKASQGELPDFSLRHHLNRAAFYGKRVVYTEHDVMAPNTNSWKAAGRKDIPFTGEIIPAGSPVCTTYTQAGERMDCWNLLREDRDNILAELIPLSTHGKQRKQSKELAEFIRGNGSKRS